MKGMISALPAAPCELFPSETADYYCRSCHATCSKLAILVGTHTNHECIPLAEAIATVPSSLLREAHEVGRNMDETFYKPRRAQEAQLNATVDYLLEAREAKQRALAQLLWEMEKTEAQLVAATEAKVVACCNWRYQRRQYEQKLGELWRGSRSMWEVLELDTKPLSSDEELDFVKMETRQGGSSTTGIALPPQHSRRTARRELMTLAEIVQARLTALREDDMARAQEWEEMLSRVGATAMPIEAGTSRPAAAAATVENHEDGEPNVRITPVMVKSPAQDFCQQQQTAIPHSIDGSCLNEPFAGVPSPPPPPQRQPQQYQHEEREAPRTLPQSAHHQPKRVHPSDMEVVVMKQLCPQAPAYAGVMSTFSHHDGNTAQQKVGVDSSESTPSSFLSATSLRTCEEARSAPLVGTTADSARWSALRRKEEQLKDALDALTAQLLEDSRASAASPPRPTTEDGQQKENESESEGSGVAAYQRQALDALMQARR